jgi:hypothetical protein
MELAAIKEILFKLIHIFNATKYIKADIFSLLGTIVFGNCNGRC